MVAQGNDTLKDLEKKELLATTLDEVDGKIPVIMNIAEQATSKAVELAKELEAGGRRINAASSMLQSK